MKDSEVSKKYHKIKQRVFLISLLLDVMLLILIQASGASYQLKSFSLTVSPNPIIANGIYISIFLVAAYLIHLPIDFFSGYVWEHRFNLSNQTVKVWIKDDLKTAFLNYIFILFVIEIIYILLGRFPSTWWIGAGTMWLFISLFLARIMPNIIIPIFFKYSPIENKELRERILTLFRECHVDIEGVYAINFSIKTKKANAFICGLGKKRRVVLADTLIENFTAPEIETVIAHELGHYRNKDIVRMIAVNSACVFLAFYIASFLFEFLSARYFGGVSIEDIAALPIFALVLIYITLHMMPVLNAFSRFIEVQADQFSLELTKKPQEFISMMEKLGNMNLAEFSPSRLVEVMFYDHPSISRRIQFARKFSAVSQ